MYAVIKTGGKQYRVKEGDVLAVERVPFEAGRPVDFDQVLLIENEDKILLGTPIIAGAVVRATAVEGFKDKKVIVFKKKRKKQYRRTKGHRQQLLRVRIDEIVPDVSLAPERKPVKPIEKKAPKPAPAPKPKVEAAPAEVKKGAKKSAPAPKKAEKPAKPPKAEKPKDKHAEKEKKHEVHKHEVHKPVSKPKKPSK